MIMINNKYYLLIGILLFIIGIIVIPLLNTLFRKKFNFVSRLYYFLVIVSIFVFALTPFFEIKISGLMFAHMLGLLFSKDVCNFLSMFKQQ